MNNLSFKEISYYHPKFGIEYDQLNICVAHFIRYIVYILHLFSKQFTINCLLTFYYTFQ